MMYCEKCGYQVNENAKFCGRCGSQIKEPIRPGWWKNKSPKTITVIILVAAIVLTAILVPLTITSCKSMHFSLEDKLTAHTWKGGNSATLTFYKSGVVEYRRDEFSKRGTWSVTGTQLKMSGFHSGTYNYWDNLSDTDIDRKLQGRKYYSWYVSDKYFVFCEDCIYGEDRTQIYKNR